MALVIDLKPQEKILIGNAVITNDSQRTRLHIAGDAPILREKDVMQEDETDTPCKKIYFLIQCMYLARNPKEYFETYFNLIKDVQTASPSLGTDFALINEQIIGGIYYKALKLAKDLIKKEETLLDHAKQQLSS